ncbi:hypothetical protein ACFFS2_38975 [Streptomyces aurantiacus]|uniref:Uncharacterized protein n=1 Tax=Streptomyces aurantiacus TaxID=47760 RepID=A0A7G1P4K9_9ACTN|nr:hypothetical protein [Streptomyces aurantiacus]BCL29942.1 hypothetical protein GCM10017557_48010 [Streptomyces aurantiacus]
MTGQTDGKFQIREGVGLAVGALVLLGMAAVGLWILGTGKRFVRETAPALLDWLGGAWGLGFTFGLVTAFGGFAGLWFCDQATKTTRLHRAARIVGMTVCWGTAFGVLMYLLGSLPGKNCPSSEEHCSYIPGSGTALVAHLLTAGLVGWAVHRAVNSREEKRNARERQRLRKLRKKGKGRSRAAARRS